MSERTLTIFVTVYNIEEHLERFFNCLKAQTYQDYEVLIIDDGSSDNSLAVCQKHVASDDRIRVIHVEHIGISAARNLVYEQIATPFAASLDGDDYVEPDYLKHLMDAREKYDADLSISRVQYELENGAVEGAFPARGELLIRQKDFEEKIPMLLNDRRLNYLYGKVYRSSLLKDIRIPDDVRQGSDTMTNFRFLKNASSIVLIDDLDYHYTRYSKRSVTSYSGEDAFNRINRINRVVYDSCEEMGILNEKMLCVIDSRVLQSGIWVIDKILASDNDDAVKAHQIDEILHDAFYLAAYERQQRRTTTLSFEPIEPQNGAVYLKKRQKARAKQLRKAQILKASPGFIVKIFHKIKHTSPEE